MNNRDFWDDRYRTLPWLGSGPGSRGIAQHYKAHLLERALRKNEIASVVDVGCGDMCWLRTDRLSARDLHHVRYVGLDISDDAVRVNGRNFPGLDFERYDLCSDPLPRRADLVVCFDVLIHQTSREQFDRCLKHLLDGITRHALVSYKNPDRPQAPAAPHLDDFDVSIEADFRRSLAELRADEPFPTAATACFGDLRQLVHALSTRHEAVHIGDYNFQSIYEIECGRRLTL